jgi:hypothetical protein
VATLATEPLLLAEERRAPEFNQFVVERCRSVGFTPTVYRGSVDSLRAAVDLVGQGRCIVCAPASCRSAVPEVVWRPLVQPVSRYPWSVLWRTDDQSEHVRGVVAAARRLSRELGWLQSPGEATGRASSGGVISRRDRLDSDWSFPQVAGPASTDER